MKLILLASASLLLSQLCRAVPIAIQNSSFEEPVTANYVSINPGLPAWEAPAEVNTYIVRSGQLTTIGGVTGNQSLFFEPYADGNSHVLQNTGATFMKGDYTLSVDVGISSGAATDGQNGDASIQLLAFDGSTHTAASAPKVLSSSKLWSHYNNYRTYICRLHVTGKESWIGQRVAIRLGVAGTKGGHWQNVSMDNVRLDWTPPDGTRLREDFDGTSGSNITSLGWTNLASQPITINSNTIDSAFCAGTAASPNTARYRKMLTNSVTLPVGKEVALTAVLRASTTGANSSSMARVEMSSSNGQRWGMQVSKIGGTNRWSLIAGSSTHSAALPAGDVFEMKIILSTKSATCYGRAYGATRWVTIQQVDHGAAVADIAGVEISLQNSQLLANIDSISLASYLKFPTGMWTSGTWIDQTGAWVPGAAGTTIAQDVKSRNFDTVVGGFDTGQAAGSTQSRGLRSVMNQADALGLKVILGFSPLMDSPGFAGMTYAQKKTALQPFVEEAKSHPSLLMYYLKDEPATATYYDQNGVDWVDVASQVKSILEELDPSRISFTAEVFSGGRLNGVVNDVGMSIAAPEAYPLWGYPWFSGPGDYRYASFPDYNNPIDLTAAYSNLYDSVGGNVAIWPVIQSHRWPTQSWSQRAPSAEELKCMTGIALAKSARGAFFFEYSTMVYYGDYPALMPELAKLAARLRDTIGPILQETRPIELATTVSGGRSGFYANGVAETFEASDGTLYLIVVNRNHEAFSTIKVTVDTQVAGHSIEINNVADVEAQVSVTSAKLGENSWRFTLSPAAGDFTVIRIGRIH
jgi:hypothetical protein